MKLSSQNAQHTLEYMILLTLIMAGIIIGGPYVIRSWNAQMKGWEDSVVDSMTDPLTGAPPNIVPITGCDFVSWGSCGFGGCCGLGIPFFGGQSVNCGEQQLLQLGVFNPPNCQWSDPSTCFSGCSPVTINGVVVIPGVARCDTTGTSSTDPNRNGCCTDWVTPSGCTPAPGPPYCPVDSDCGVNVGCPDGQYRRTHTCDEGYTETECVPDPGCNFTCINPLPGLDETTSPPTLSNATFCAGDNAGLLGDTNYVIMSSCTPAKCEFVCNPTFVYNGSACVCPAGQTVVGGVCCFSVYQCPNGDPDWQRNQCIGQLSTASACLYVDSGGEYIASCPFSGCMVDLPCAGTPVYQCPSGDPDWQRNQCMSQLSTASACLYVDSGGEYTAGCPLAGCMI